MLLQALRHSFLIALGHTVISNIASPYPVDCAEIPTKVRRGYLDNLPVGLLPAATPRFVAPIFPTILPIEAVAALIGSSFIFHRSTESH